MAKGKGAAGGTVEDIDRQIAALQAERAKAVRKRETEAISALRSFMKSLPAERVSDFVSEVRKACDSELASRS